MHIHVRNVNEAFRGLVEMFRQAAQGEAAVAWEGEASNAVLISRKPSRVGEVLQIEEPVIITYEKPWERVLFNPARDANPFFNLYEAIHMLAGRNDVASLGYYNSKIAEMVSDDGKTQNGAYGHRWRHWPVSLLHPFQEVDQLHVIAEHLKQVNGSRRAVLQMWDPNKDLMKNLYKLDIPCNTEAYFSIRSYTGPAETTEDWGKDRRYLDMTVLNRSNDLIWGALGANAVHFSLLQEYLAARIGVHVGRYNQVTNNLHVYTERFEPDKWLAAYEPRKVCSKHWALDEKPTQFHSEETCDICGEPAKAFRAQKQGDYYDDERVGNAFRASHIPIEWWHGLDIEIEEFAERHSRDGMAYLYCCKFLRNVAQPMCIAYHHYKRGALREALQVADQIHAGDWRIAAKEWLERRLTKRERKEATK